EHEVHDRAAEQVHQQHRGAGGLDRAGRAVEQAGADRGAEGDEVEVSRRESGPATGGRGGGGRLRGRTHRGGGSGSGGGGGSSAAGTSCASDWVRRWGGAGDVRPATSGGAGRKARRRDRTPAVDGPVLIVPQGHGVGWG